MMRAEWTDAHKAAAEAVALSIWCAILANRATSAHEQVKQPVHGGGCRLSCACGWTAGLYLLSGDADRRYREHQEVPSASDAPAPVRLRAVASFWLGHVEAENGCTLNDIEREACVTEIAETGNRKLDARAFVAAMWTAFAAEAMASGRGSQSTAPFACESGAGMHDGRELSRDGGCRWSGGEPAPSWFNDHARFELPVIGNTPGGGPWTWAGSGRRVTRAFVIPPLVIAS